MNKFWIVGMVNPHLDTESVVILDKGTALDAGVLTSEGGLDSDEFQSQFCSPMEEIVCLVECETSSDAFGQLPLATDLVRS